MKAITLTQPWATLVAIGAKKIETRSWRTNYRGPLAIHAAAGLGPVGGRRGLYEQCMREPFYTALDRFGYSTGLDLPLGEIVAVCRLWDVLPTENFTSGFRPTDQERAFGDYAPGRFAWLLADVRALPEPIPARGALGLWNYGGEL